MKAYVSPDVEFIKFDNEKILANSKTCRCYYDYGVKEDYNAPDDNCTCYVLSFDATEAIAPEA